MNDIDRMNKRYIFILNLLMGLFVLTACHERKAEGDLNRNHKERLEQLASDSVFSNPHLSDSLLRVARRLSRDSIDFYVNETMWARLYFAEVKYDSARLCLDRAERFVARCRPSKRIYGLRTLIANRKGLLYQYMSQGDSAVIYYRQAVNYCTASDNIERLPDIYINLADAYANQGDYPMQTACYRRGLWVSDSLRLPASSKYPFYSGLGLCYLRIKDFAQSQDYLQKADRFYAEMPLRDRFFLYNTFVNLYYYKEDYRTAWDYVGKALAMIDTRKVAMALEYHILLVNYAELAIKLNRELDTAQRYIRACADFFVKNRMESVMYHIETLQIALALRKNNLPEARRLIAHAKANPHPNPQWDWVTIRDTYLIDYYRQVKDYRQAFDYLEEKSAIDDSLRNTTRLSYIAELNMRYVQDTTRLNHRIIIEQQEGEIRVLHWEILAGGLVGALVLLLLVGYAFYMKRKRTMQYHKYLNEMSKLKMQNIRNCISPHFTFNVLNSEIQSHDSSAKGKHERLMQLTRLLRKSLELSGQIAVSLREELDFVTTYVHLVKECGSKEFEFTIHASPGIRFDDIKLPSMIIQIVVENAIKHGFTGDREGQVLTVDLQEERTGIAIDIVNNGEAYMPSAQPGGNGTGTGMKVIYQSLMIMNLKNKEKITFHIQSRAAEGERGTKVSIFIPYHFDYTL